MLGGWSLCLRRALAATDSASWRPIILALPSFGVSWRPGRIRAGGRDSSGGELFWSVAGDRLWKCLAFQESKGLFSQVLPQQPQAQLVQRARGLYASHSPTCTPHSAALHTGTHGSTSAQEKPDAAKDMRWTAHRSYHPVCHRQTRGRGLGRACVMGAAGHTSSYTSLTAIHTLAQAAASCWYRTRLVRPAWMRRAIRCQLSGISAPRVLAGWSLLAPQGAVCCQL